MRQTALPWFEVLVKSLYLLFLCNVVVANKDFGNQRDDSDSLNNMPDLTTIDGLDGEDRDTATIQRLKLSLRT